MHSGLPSPSGGLPRLLSSAEELPQVVSTSPHPAPVPAPPSPPRPQPVHPDPIPSSVPTPAAVDPDLYSCRYPPPIEQGSDEAKEEDDAAAAAKLTHIGSLDNWWSKGPQAGELRAGAKVVTEA